MFKISVVVELIFYFSGVTHICDNLEFLYNVDLSSIPGDIIMIYFCVLSLGKMTNLFVLSSMLDYLIDPNINLDLNLIYLDLDLNLILVPK